MTDGDQPSAINLIAALRARRQSDELQKQADVLAAAGKFLKGRDRSKIARSVVWALLGLVTSLVVYAGYAGLTPGLWEQVEPATQFALTLLSTVLLPIVTLVLGYYFGKGDGDESE